MCVFFGLEEHASVIVLDTYTKQNGKLKNAGFYMVDSFSSCQAANSPNAILLKEFVPTKFLFFGYDMR